MAHNLKITGSNPVRDLNLHSSMTTLYSDKEKIHSDLNAAGNVNMSE